PTWAKSTRQWGRNHVTPFHSKLTPCKKQMEKLSTGKVQGSYRNGLSYKEALLKKNTEHLESMAAENGNSQNQDLHLAMEASVDNDQVAWLRGCFVGQVYELEQ
ncbi:hypothetical protein Ancab_020658, partial [Ancistrocladus abbreviatus]